MKKLMAALFTASLLIGSEGHALASEHFGELNLKAGCALNGKGDLNFEIITNAHSDYEGKSSISMDLDPVFSLTGEYLVPCSHFFQDKNVFKFGVGLSYLPSLNLKELNLPNDCRFSCLPIYFTLQANPFAHKLLRRIFIKGNIGYSLNLSNEQSVLDKLIRKASAFGQISKKHTGGSYYGLSAGYEFPAGIIIDVTYCVCKFDSEYTSTLLSSPDPAKLPSNASITMKTGYTVRLVALNVGYKFKI
jgi:hypothetical protein